jgi:hypothetical protein
MSNITGIITFLIGAVAAGVSVWFVSKQHHRKEVQKHRKETERLLAQLEQERCQREAVERLRKQEQEQCEQAKRRLQAQLEEVTAITPKITSNFASKLRDLLGAGKWEKADEETLKIMLKVTDREKEGWLDVASIQNLPCEDLRTIDQLWLESSNGRFGLSVQKRIWKSEGGNLKADDKIYEAFGDRVGWRVNKNWLQIDDLTFKPSAPVGHLPATAVRFGGLSWGVDGFWWEKREAYVLLLSQKDW